MLVHGGLSFHLLSCTHVFRPPPFTSATARRALERAGAHALSVYGAAASLAPLLGYGCAKLREPQSLAAQAEAVFRTATLSFEARALLYAAAAEADSGSDACAVGSLARRTPHFQRRRLSLGGVGIEEASPARARRSEYLDPAARPRRSALGALWAAHAEHADAYVLDTPDDSRGGALRALCTWAERFEALIMR
jgi:hypothetical protein